MTGTRNRSADARILQLSEISTFDAWPWCSKNETHLHASQPRLFAEGLIATPDYLQVHIFIRVQFIVRSWYRYIEAGHAGLSVCWLIKDRLRRGYKAQLLQHFRK